MSDYKIIYVDPPWSFNSKKTGGSMKSGALTKYPTMTIEEMKKLDVGSLAGDNCLLAMWYVSSQPQEALDLISAWGFKLRNFNGFVWNKLTKNGKPHFGMGFYTRAGAEMVAFATKGKPSEIIKNHGVRQVLSAPIGRHSEKPDDFRKELVKMCGNAKRVELFAREKFEGWDSWGNEVDNGGVVLNENTN